MVTMTQTATKDRDRWSPLLDQLSREHEGESVRIEILDPTYGDHPEAERLPFSYASYDYKDDVVIVAVGGRSERYPVVLRHMISHPTELDATQQDPAALRVVDDDGTVTLVSFTRDGS
jgi:cellulose synthase/poly-beta-1,6-N-acetylglucosamine synthase-like glycosyltransferase